MSKRYLFYFFHLLIIIDFIDSQKGKLLHKCIFDDNKMKSVGINIKSFDKNDSIYRRRLQDMDKDGFKNFNIYVDLTNIKEEVKEFNLTHYENIFVNSITKVVETLKSLLKVKSLNNNYNLDNSTLEDLQIKYWDKTKFGTEAKQNGITLTKLGIDLLILVRFEDLGQYTLAQAGCRLHYRETGQPLVGLVEISKTTDYSIKHSREYLESILIHEFTHILGFNYNYFKNYFNNVFTRPDQYGINRTYVNSSKVVEVARKYYNCSDIDGVELEDFGGIGTVNSHWEARILLGDYMNGYVYPEEQVISEFTLALLEDSGYYKANYFTGGLMRYGKNKGCEFIRNKCVNASMEINPLFENEFFDSTVNNIDLSCTSGRQSRGYYAFWIRKIEDYPTNPNYLNITDYGGFPSADFCPILEIPTFEKNYNYYVGHCSEMGSGEYGLFLKKYRLNFNTNQEMKLLTGETYSNHSFCFLSSLLKKELNNIINYSNFVRAVCFEIYCSSKSLTVKINDYYIICPRSGGKINVNGFDGFFLCPDYNLMCSGTVVCNNMFECVEKKSEIKEESYLYDYNIKTTQNVDRAENEDFDNEDNYELSDDGLCPKNCKYCLENKKCLNCRNTYNLVAEINEEKIICLPDIEIEKGYYLYNNSLYYKCIENCEICSNGTSCDICKNNFNLSNHPCIESIPNCKEYDNNQMCKKCIENFAFKEEERNKCINKTEFDNYYSKDEGISYFECDGEGEEHIKNCKKCHFNNNTLSLECSECKNSFIILEKERNQCYSKEIMNDNHLYYYLNDTHIKLCSDAINNCLECETDSKCIKCNNDYYLKNNDTTKCYNINEINPIDEYYLDENNLTYYSCNNSEYNSIENCKKCSSKNTCSLCNEGLTFINRNKTKCFDINELENKYYQDPNDISNYNSCSEININCITCSSFNNCLSCSNGFGLYKDRNTCVNISNNKYYRNERDNLYYPCNESLGCVQCNDFENCISCDEIEFTLINNTCLNISELGNKYYKDENTLKYKLCKEGILNCETCYSNRECIKCFSDYTKINNEKDFCHLISDLKDKYYKDPNDETNYLNCSNLINNCLSCNNSNCIVCEKDYIFINDNFNNCLLKSSIDIENYFTNDNITYYSCKENQYKNNPKCQIIKVNSTIPNIFPKTSDIQITTLINTRSTIIQTTTPNNVKTTNIHTTTTINTGTTNVKTTSPLNTPSSIIKTTTPINSKTSIIRTTTTPNNSKTTNIHTTIPINSITTNVKTTSRLNTQSSIIKTTTPINSKTSIIRTTTTPNNVKTTNIQTSTPINTGTTNVKTTSPLNTPPSSIIKTTTPINSKTSIIRTTTTPNNSKTTNIHTTTPINSITTNVKTTSPLNTQSSIIKTTTPINSQTSIIRTTTSPNNVKTTNIHTTTPFNSKTSIFNTITSINSKTSNIQTTIPNTEQISNIKSTTPKIMETSITQNTTFIKPQSSNVQTTIPINSNIQTTTPINSKTTNIHIIKTVSTNSSTTNTFFINDTINTLIKTTNIKTVISTTNNNNTKNSSPDLDTSIIYTIFLLQTQLENNNLNLYIKILYTFFIFLLRACNIWRFLNTKRFLF